MRRQRGVVVLLALWAVPAAALDVPAVAPDASQPATEGTASEANRSPSSLLRGLRSAVMPPLKVFAQAPPITRSWVSMSIMMAVLTSQRVIDARNICFSEPMVLHGGEWWRLLTNFFFMGDALKSIFFWVQIHHFWECCKMLELVKYRWEPADFIKLIVCNAAMLLVLKQLFPSTIFLGTPMVMAFLYMYAREYELQVMNLLGFFSIRCGWLPFAQMLQDLLQAGDVSATQGSRTLATVCALMHSFATRLTGHTQHPRSHVWPHILLLRRGDAEAGAAAQDKPR